jgi:flavin-dependent dehydrogenase
MKAQIGIIGAGPAGARAAERLAAQGAEVVLFDPRVPWEKPCGGGLTAAAIENIPELAEVARRARRMTSVRLESDRSTIEVPLERPLYVLSRTALGQWQLDRARLAGATLEPAAVTGVERKPGHGWRLTLADGRKSEVRLLVGADGAASRVRRVVAPGLEIELAPTRVAFVPGAGRTPGAIGLRFFRGVDGYAWDFPRPHHRSIGVGIAPGTWARPRMDAEVDRYWSDLGHCGCTSSERAGAVIGTAAHPLGSRFRLLAGGDYALLGDAAGLADPATGEGIENAMRSADFLARAFERDGTFVSYPRLVERHLEPEFVVARRVRRVLYGTSLAGRLIDLASSHRWAYALLAAVVNGGNAHDPSLLRRFATEWRRVAGDGRRSRLESGRAVVRRGGSLGSGAPSCDAGGCVTATGCGCGAG